MSVVKIDLSEAPPSVNHAFRNLPGRGRVKTGPYKAWLQASSWEIAAQRAGRMGGSVMVDMSIGRLSAMSDVDNRIKGILDLLVQNRVIDDDRFVQEVRARWVAKRGCRVIIMSIGGS